MMSRKRRRWMLLFLAAGQPSTAFVTSSVSSSYTHSKLAAMDLQDVFTAITTRLDRIDQQMQNLGDDIDTMKHDVYDIKRNMTGYDQNYWYAQSLADLVDLVPDAVASLCRQTVVDIWQRQLEPLVPDVAETVLSSIQTEWTQAIQIKQHQLCEEELAELHQYTTLAFTSTTTSSVDTLYNSNPPSRISHVQYTARFLAVNSLGHLLDVNYPLSQTHAIVQDLLNYFQRKELGLFVLNVVARQGRLYFDKTTHQYHPLQLPPRLRLYSLFYDDNVHPKVRQQIRNSNLLKIPTELKIGGTIHVVPTPVEYSAFKAFCILKSSGQDIQQVEEQLDVMHLMMVLLLTELEGRRLGEWHNVHVADVDFSRQAKTIRLRLDGGPPRERQMNTQELTSIVQLEL